MHEWPPRHGIIFAAIMLAACLDLPAAAQSADSAGAADPASAASSADGPEPAGAAAFAAAAEQNVPWHPYTLREDLKAFATWPAQWSGRDWLKFAGVAAAVNVAYRQDDEVHDHYGNPGEPDYHEVQDALPAAIAFGTMWFGARGRNPQARWEVDAMRRAFIVSAVSTEVIKVALRRERPSPGAPKDNLGADDLSFPSGHTASAFAIGTVLAESGDDKHRALRRSLGYGIGVYTAYQRVNHDTHWFSDTIAGAALGIAAAKFIMKRRDGTEPKGQLWVSTTDDGGPLITYTVPLR
jgi:membrane-associated phospholipid phosphatase